LACLKETREDANVVLCALACHAGADKEGAPQAASLRSLAGLLFAWPCCVPDRPAVELDSEPKGARLGHGSLHYGDIVVLIHAFRWLELSPCGLDGFETESSTASVGQTSVRILVGGLNLDSSDLV
jgi:hypothetical protein